MGRVCFAKKGSVVWVNTHKNHLRLTYRLQCSALEVSGKVQASDKGSDLDSSNTSSAPWERRRDLVGKIGFSH